MIRKLLFILAVVFITAGLFLFVKVLDSFKSPGRGALQVTTNIKSKVFLNGKEIGTAPLCKCTDSETLPSGQYDLRIEPEDASLSAFNSKISINGGVLTAVERAFLPGAYASASILTLERTDSKSPELVITSLPDNAIVTVDSIPQGVTPIKIGSLSISEHELKLSKDGFKEKTLQIKMIENHRLVIEVYLGTVNSEEIISSDENTNQSDNSPSEKILEEAENQSAQTVTILNTPNGFLRVRSGAGTNFSEIARVNSGETFDLLGEQSGWYKIQIDENTTGFISSQYAEKN